MKKSANAGIHLDGGAIYVTNDPVITYDHIAEKTDSDHTGATTKNINTTHPTLTRVIVEAALMAALFMFCAWMSFAG